MRKSKTAAQTTPVESLKHKDKRRNIPTEELRDFVADDEKQPKTVLYPRDPSLDPQLVWKGKDEQDSRDLAVPAVPVYIQEKIQPRAIIENVRAQAKKAAPEPQMALFGDFNGIEFEDLIDFYRHEQNWANRMILGDSLLVMTSLAEKEGLKGQVQMIYLDPPYGIKFGSNWQVSTRKRDVKDGKADDTTRQPEQIKAFRDTWELGIHSYLAYLRDRLTVARELLTESGSIFVQIGDENVHLARNVLDEIFGSENFEALITFRKTSITFATDRLGGVCDYILWYTKSSGSKKYRQLYAKKEVGGAGATNYGFIELPDGTRRRVTSEEWNDPKSIIDKGRLFSTENLISGGYTESCMYDFEFDGKRHQPLKGKSWKTHREGMARLATAGRLLALGNERLYFVTFFDEYPITKLTNAWYDTRGEMDLSYIVQTNTEIVQRCVLMTTDPGDLVLDPTCGSGTTAYVAEQWGRRWITIDTSRVAIALARTRLMAGRFPYYHLADSPEGVKLESEATGQLPPTPLPKTTGDIKKGFVYERVPHVTLGSIANNPDIIDGMSREEIDKSIARHADTELLYDRPYEDNKRIRVTGPFTVESLSPHRVLQADQERPTSEASGRAESSVGQFETMIIENLKKAGVQNTVKKERLKFDRLEPFAGTWLHAAGEYTETPPSPKLGRGEGAQAEGQVKRVAVSIGPEHGTVGPEQVKEAAKEAVQGVGFDLLIVCGFAFDPHVSEEAKRYGKLAVLTARMNPDLAMGDELLKKTGAGNLFMVFGEPDLDVKPQKDGKLVVKVKGVDVYDPTTGQIRSSSTDDIACWFIDTDYNGESFFVRHAYFTGAGDPYERLKRALRAEIDEAAWSALYSTKSYPFDPPKSGKIAVKVINHYGDEVLKVYEVGKGA